MPDPIPPPGTQVLPSASVDGTGFRSLLADDVSACVDLIARAMDANEARYARSTLDFHFECARRGVDDGRRLYVCGADGRIAGMVGLHFYVWGPPENVWLSWFAVDPGRQGCGTGSRLLAAAVGEAVRLGYATMLIETYASPTFAKATRFYLAHGFRVAGTIAGYLPDGSSMVVLSRSIQRAGEDASERTDSTGT